MNNPPTHPKNETSESDNAPTSASASQMPKLVIPFILVIVLTITSGIVHGVIDGRWTASKDLVAQGDQLAQIPEQCGDWTLAESIGLEDNANEMLRCYGSQVLAYHHDHSDATVTVAVLFGPRGPIAVHTPEVCYSSVGTEQIGKRRVETIRHAGDNDQFWSVQFSQRPSTDPSLDVWYGWSDGSEWVASENPRFWMTDTLYKIQVAGPVGDDGFRPCEDFLKDFLPMIDPLIN